MIGQFSCVSCQNKIKKFTVSWFSQKSLMNKPKYPHHKNKALNYSVLHFITLTNILEILSHNYRSVLAIGVAQDIISSG